MKHERTTIQRKQGRPITMCQRLRKADRNCDPHRQDGGRNADSQKRIGSEGRIFPVQEPDQQTAAEEKRSARSGELRQSARKSCLSGGKKSPFLPERENQKMRPERSRQAINLIHTEKCPARGLQSFLEISPSARGSDISPFWTSSLRISSRAPLPSSFSMICSKASLPTMEMV